NDCYGFLRGDEMIRCLARVLSRALPGLAADAKLGHIGGDDFVIVAPGGVSPEGVAALCAQFDAGKIDLFDPKNVEGGSCGATDGRGQEVSVPLITLSVGVVPSESVHGTDHPGALAQMAASLKRKVKETSCARGRSAFLFERRRLQPAAP